MTTSEWTNVGDVELPEGFIDDVPEPVLWRMVVMPKAPEKVTGGGIILTATNQEEQGYRTHVGQVLKLGPLVGCRDPINQEFFDVEVGHWIVFGKYAGQRIEIRGIKLIFLNDEDVLATTKAPELLKAAV